MTMTYAEQVRTKYGDDVRQFATRIGANEITIKRWEAGKPVPLIGGVMLHLACRYKMELKPKLPEDYAKLTPREKLEYLRDVSGLNWKQFCNRIGLNYSVVLRWKRTGKICKMGLRLLDEVAARPKLLRK